MQRAAAVLALAAFGLACGKDENPAASSSAGAAPTSTLGFFVSSSKSTTGNLGGLRGADARC